MHARLPLRTLALAGATAALLALLALMLASALGGRPAVAAHGYGHAGYALTLDPAAATRPVGDTHAVIATLTSGPFAVPSTPIRYAISGAHSGSDTVTTNPRGQAAIGWTGVRRGDDALFAYADIDRDGARDGDEPVAAASVRWQPGARASISFPRSNRSILVDARGRFRFRVVGTPGLDVRAAFRTVRAFATAARVRRLVVGSRAFTIPRSGRATVRVQVRRGALRVLRRRGRLSVRARVRAGGLRTTSYTFTLRSRSPR